MEIITIERKKKFNTLLMTRSDYYLNIHKSLEIIADFIRNKKLIIYGGMAIDFALKAIGKKGIYGNDIIPDYDFFSIDSVGDSNELGIILRDAGLPNISCINALHKSTRRVRINFVNVADITYRPKDVFEKIPTFEYDGFLCVHPHFQKIDMHRSSVYLLENPPLETIKHRIVKDMVRYNLLESAYPTGVISGEFDELVDIHIPIKNLSKAVLCGPLVYAVYVEILRRAVKSSEIDIKMDKLILTEYNTAYIKVPNNYKDIFNICILTDDFPPTLTSNIKNVKYYNQILDIVPRRVEYEMTKNKHVIFDNKGKVTSTSIFDYEIVNIQWLLMYTLFNYHLNGDIRYKNIYIATQHLVKYADKIYKKIKLKSVDEAEIFRKSAPFFINTNNYGKYNQSDPFLYMFREKYNKIMDIQYENYRPDVFFPSNGNNWNEYDYNKMKLNGEEVDLLLEKEVREL